MARRLRPGIVAAGAAALALGAGGWALAQQGAAVTPDQGSVKTPPAPVQASAPVAADEDQPPPTESQLQGAVAPASPSSEASDVEPAEAGSSEAASAAAAAKPAAPMTRPRFAVAVLQALDKVTAETIRFEAPVGKPIRYKSLIFIVHACETNAPDETEPDAVAHVEIDSAPIPQQGAVALSVRRLFRGWMYANAPGLNLFENPDYDAWVIACKTASPAA